MIHHDKRSYGATDFGSLPAEKIAAFLSWEEQQQEVAAKVLEIKREIEATNFF